MAQQIINYGNVANDGTGDPLRDAFIKVDDNFTQIWAAGPVGSNITIQDNTIAVTNTNGNLILMPNGVGVIQTNSKLLPRLDNTYDLGSSELRYRTLNVGAGGITTSGNLNLSSIGNLKIQGGTNGYIIQTDGQGNLNWIALPGEGNGAPGGTTGQVQYNNSGLFGGSTTFTFDKFTANLLVGNTTANIGNITTGNVYTNRLNVNPIGQRQWSIYDELLVAPTGAFWQSDVQTNDEFINSASNGYLNFRTFTTVGNLASDIHMEHGLIHLQISDGVNQLWTFTDDGTFTAAGNITAPGNISGNYILGDGSQLINLPGGVIQGAIPPVNPNDTTLWWDDITGRLYIWYTDQDGSQWVDASPAAPANQYGNANVSIYLASGINTAGYTTLGNVTANSFIGDGSQLTNVSASINAVGGNGQIQINKNGFLGAATHSLNYDDTSNTLYVITGTFSGSPVTGSNGLYVGNPSFTILGSPTLAQLTGNVANYTQINFQNTSNSVIASSDYIITADDGTDTTKFLDLGLTNSGWDGTQPNSLGNRIGPNEGYLYVQDGNLNLGTKVTAGNTNVWTFATSGNTVVPGSIMPDISNVYSLGNSTNQWKDLWVSNNTIYINSVPVGLSAGNVLTVDGEAVLSNNSTTDVTTTGNITAGIVNTAKVISGNSAYVQLDSAGPGVNTIAVQYETFSDASGFSSASWSNLGGGQGNVVFSGASSELINVLALVGSYYEPQVVINGTTTANVVSAASGRDVYMIVDAEPGTDPTAVTSIEFVLKTGLVIDPTGTFNGFKLGNVANVVISSNNKEWIFGGSTRDMLTLPGALVTNSVVSPRTQNGAAFNSSDLTLSTESGGGTDGRGGNVNIYAGGPVGSATDGGAILIGAQNTNNIYIGGAPGYASTVTATFAGNVDVAGVVKTGVYVTGTIPDAAAVGPGARAFVTDADSVSFGNAYVGGAANSMPVFSNGTSWFIG